MSKERKIWVEIIHKGTLKPVSNSHVLYVGGCEENNGVNRQGFENILT
jgi:hypothetical protein